MAGEAKRRYDAEVAKGAKVPAQARPASFPCLPSSLPFSAV